MRVVSLLPAATEICYGLGVEPVAVSTACDYPPAARARPVVDRSRVRNAGSSAAVNEAVADAATAGGVYDLDRGALHEAAPDVVLAQGVCDVCAVDAGLARAAVAAVGSSAEVVTLHAHTFEGVLEDVERVGAAVGRSARAASLVADLRDRVDAVGSAAGQGRNRPRVVVLDWMDPPMVAGHWVPELVATAGGAYGLADPADRSSPREWHRIVEYDPEVLVAAPCGFDLARTLEHAGELTGRPGWAGLAAVESGRAYAMDGDGHVNRPGPRLVDTLEHFAGLIDADGGPAPPSEAVAPLVGD